MAKAFGCDAYGTELSETRSEYARSNGIKVITLNELPNVDFGFIRAKQVFEHIPQPLEILDYLRKSLKPEGLIMIKTPKGDDIKRRLRVLNWAAPKGHRVLNI